MLYITTRDNRDAHTAHKALHLDTAPDGGMFIPFHLPVFTREELKDLSGKSAGEIISAVLNIFFSARLTGWDIDSAIGRTPVKVGALNRKIFSAELWRNLECRYAYLEKQLLTRLTPNGKTVSSWTKIAIHIAVLFAVYGYAVQQNQISSVHNFDLCVKLGDFTPPVAALYAKRMGLPVGNIILCDEDNSAMWDLFNRAQMGTSLLNPQRKLGAERFIHLVLGSEETKRFSEVCQKHGVYTVTEEQLPLLNDGFFASVVGKNRISTTINSTYRTNQYLVSPEGAICYAGLQDYRAKAGESCPTILMDYDAPSVYADEVQNATGLSFEDIIRLQKAN